MSNSPASPESIKAIVHEFICEEFLLGEDPSALGDTTPLIGTGILDSISTLRLISYLETRFAIILEQDDVTVEHLNTVERIARVVAQKLGQTV